MVAVAVAAAVIAVAAALILFAIWPSGSARVRRAEFPHRLFAHRGLYDKDQTVPENSLPAFERACAAGYGIELDVQLTRDGHVVVFHDDDLKRVCGVDRRVDGTDLSELRSMRLYESGETAPLFADLLALVGGRVPLLVELKTGKRNGELCDKVIAMLKDYGGEYCVESFDPRIIARFRKDAPEVYRGVLSQPPKVFKSFGFSSAVSLLLGWCMLNFLARPDFIAYRVGRKPAIIRLQNKLGAADFGWTVTEPEQRNGLDAAIFEHFVPKG